MGVGVLTLCGLENPSVIYSRLSVYAVTHIYGSSTIHSFNSVDSTDQGSRGTIVFTVEKTPGMIGPAQFKLMLFKVNFILKKKPVTKDPILHDFFHMKCPE